MQQKPQYRDRVIVLDSDIFDISQSRLQLKQPGPHTVLLHLEPTEALH